ncbi:hypothetical protein 1013_scaffold3125_00041 [Bacteriophage sp.]|nr:hypothetical protein 1013_scaffold3125_00041 [Bacteriophage sp.]
MRATLVALNFKGEHLEVGVRHLFLLVVLCRDINVSKLNALALFQTSSFLCRRSSNGKNKAGKVLLVLIGLLVLSADRQPNLCARVAHGSYFPNFCIGTCTKTHSVSLLNLKRFLEIRQKFSCQHGLCNCKVVAALCVLGYKLFNIVCFILMHTEILFQCLIKTLNDLLGNHFVLCCFRCSLLATECIRVCIRCSNIEELEQEITIRICQTRAKCLRSISLLPNKRPLNIDTLFRVVVINPRPHHIRANQDLVVVFFIDITLAGSLGLFVCIWGHNCAALLDVRNQRQTILVHKYRDFCENLILGNILVTVATLVLLDDLHLLSDSGKFLINVYLFCHFTPPLNMSLPCRQDAAGAPVCYAQKSYQ